LQDLTDLLQRLQTRLATHSHTPVLDAQVLLAHVLDRSRTWVLAHPEAVLTIAQQEKLAADLAQLESGVPLPYVIGHWEFYGLDFTLTPAVLIPRPETELLVEQALGWLRIHPALRLVFDIGTGSGCIAVTLAANFSNLKVIATDVSLTALCLASDNALRHGVAARLHFLQSDLLSSFPLGKGEPGGAGLLPPCLLCANLPYIPTQVLTTLPLCGREPTLALDGGPYGLSLIHRLLAQAAPRLAPGSLLLAEIEASQGSQVLQLARATFPKAEVRLLSDLAGNDRLLSIPI
jgi:release factor glutamine methyltransferase